jgi:Holliday junction resolvasome RuvABC endonuclease subunit
MRLSTFDLSLTESGFTAPGGRFGVLKPPMDASRGMARIRWIRDSVLDVASGSDIVVLEGYAFGAKGNAFISLAELGGVVRCALADISKRYVDVPPASLKLFATGKGNAKKDEVLAAAIRSLQYPGHNHNEADALWLRAMSIAALTSPAPDAPLSETKARALAKITWPSAPRTLTEVQT